ncbi:MAG: substrate-binding periplasmic protein [Motilibacteraceae bacterium]
MKRITPVLAVGLGMSLLTACGGGSSPSAGAAAQPSANGSSASTSSGCTPKHPGLKTISPGALTVAAYVYPPFSDTQGGTLGGAEGEIVSKIAEMECLTVKVSAGDAAAMIPSIQTGRADTCIGSWYRTAARQKVVTLSAPVIADRLTLVSKDGVSTVQELKGRKVGSILGFLWNDDLKKLLGGDVKFYQSADSMYADLAAGRISVVVDTYPSAQSVLKKTPIDGVQFKVPPADPAVVSTQKPGQTNFPVNKSNPDLAKAFDDDIAALRASGDLEKIAVKYGFQPEAVQPGEPNLL